MNLLKRFRFFLHYLNNPPWDTNQSPPELIRFITTHPPGNALDLGCGTGTNAIELARNGWQVTGIDFINKPLRLAAKKAKKAGIKVNFLQADVTRLQQIHQSFDFILDIGCYHSLDLPSRIRYQKNIKNLLTIGGTYLLYAFTTNNISGRGVSHNDITAFTGFLELTQVEYGSDRNRPSAWYTFYNQSKSRLLN